MVIDFAFVLVVLTAVSGVIWAIDKWLLRQRRHDKAAALGEAPREPLAVEYSRSLFPVLLAVLIFRSFLFEPFKIPSGSMIPTLLVGDFIVVNKYAYGLRLPVVNTKVVPLGEPERGDVVVFRYPVDPSINFIKRVVGLPGDTVTWRGKRLYINGELQDTEPAGPYTTDAVKCDTPRADAVRYVERLGVREHGILLHSQSRGRDGQWTVPAGHFFVMGDNRDRSNDSREWGFVAEEELLGKAIGIWLNLDYNRGCFDWSRIGNGIH